MHKSLTVALSLSVVLVASTAGAADRHARHLTKSDRLHVPAETAHSPYADSRTPAHMVEVKPGVWVSSYGCVIDDGHGRPRNCSDVRVDR